MAQLNAESVDTMSIRKPPSGSWTDHPVFLTFVILIAAACATYGLGWMRDHDVFLGGISMLLFGVALGTLIGSGIEYISKHE